MWTGEDSFWRCPSILGVDAMEYGFGLYGMLFLESIGFGLMLFIGRCTLGGGYIMFCCCCGRSDINGGMAVDVGGIFFESNPRL